MKKKAFIAVIGLQVDCMSVANNEKRLVQQLIGLITVGPLPHTF